MAFGKVSIIIPVYNAEKYLYECLDSVLGLNYKNIEAILINDGSSDRSKDICEEYQKKDARFIFIDKENEGVSVARNTALHYATGEWITFLDADDMLYKDAFDCLEEECAEGCDVICYGHMRDMSKTRNNSKRRHIVNNKDMQLSILRFPLFSKNNKRIDFLNYIDVWTCWGKLFQRKIIENNGVEFSNNLKIGEDLVFCFNVYKYVETVLLCERYIYYYRCNNLSVTAAASGVKKDSMEQTKNLISEMRCSIEEDQIENFYYFAVNRIINCIRTFFCHELCPIEQNKRKETLKEFCQQPELQEAIKHCGYRTISLGKRANTLDKVRLFCLKRRLYGCVLILGRY